MVNDELRRAIMKAATGIGISPVDLATVMSYETGGTLDPWQKGPTTKWGQHRGLIQWGEPQRKKYGVSENTPLMDRVPAWQNYLTDAGVKPGMGLLDVYSAVNAGRVGRYNASDAHAGGAPGTVADKVRGMGAHRKKAVALMGGKFAPKPVEQKPQFDQAQLDFMKNNPQPGGYGPSTSEPDEPMSFSGPTGSVPSGPPPIPPEVAQFATAPEGGPNMMQRLGAALSQIDGGAPPPPPIARFTGGSGPGNQLLKYLNSPEMKDVLMRKRLSHV